MKVRKFLKKLDSKECLICFCKTDTQESPLYNINDIKSYSNNDDMFLVKALQSKIKSIRLGTTYKHDDRFNNDCYVPIVFIEY